VVVPDLMTLENCTMADNDSQLPTTPDDEWQQQSRWIALLLIFVSMSAVTAHMVDGRPLRSANDRSRWCTVWSIVERDTYEIDEIRQVRGWDTIDLVRHNDHFYSTKPPLMPRMVAEVYRAVQWATGWTLTENTAETTQTILFLVNILPMSIALWCLCSLFRRYCEQRFGALFLMMVVCFGALYLPYLTVLNNHTVALTSIIFAITLAISITVEGKESWWRYALCGMFAAFGCCNELPAAAFGAILFLFMARHNFKRTALAFVPGALIPLVAFFMANYAATGSWKPFYMYYGTEKYLFVHEGIPSYWMSPKGVDSSRDSFWTYFMHCTVGHHGILSLTPIYIITLFGWIGLGSWWNKKLRAYIGMGILLTIIVLGFYLSKTENYNYGGVSVSLRWTLWLTPFWLLAMIPVLNAVGRFRVVQVVACSLLSVSVFSAWYPSGSPWTQPWTYRLMDHLEWIDYSDARPKFDRKHSSWIGSLPEGTAVENAWIRYESYDTSGTVEAVTLAMAAPIEAGKCPIVVTWSKNDAIVSQNFVIDANAFREGKIPSAFLLADESDPITTEVLQFFQGVPKARLYSSSQIRHVRLAMRKDAFQCHKGYTYIEIPASSGKRQYVRDVWYTDEVPFGVVQWEDRVLELPAKTELSRKYWRAVACGEFYPREEKQVENK